MRTSGEGRQPGWRSVALAAGLVAAAALQGREARAARPETIVTVRGVVTDASGAAVAGHTVRLIKTRTIHKLKSPRSQDQGVEEKRAMTDGEGRFELEFALDPSFPAYFVRFFDPALFDAVKYLVPGDLEITRQSEKGGVVEAHVVLRLHPDWPQVKALIAEYGAASPRGQILRSLGLPKHKEDLGEGRELWVFEAAGVSYVIEGEKVVETRKTGGARSGTAAPAATPGQAEPEEHVNDR
jgi:hypothetical protein